jgi:hypothetical protein
MKDREITNLRLKNIELIERLRAAEDKVAKLQEYVDHRNSLNGDYNRISGPQSSRQSKKFDTYHQ